MHNLDVWWLVGDNTNKGRNNIVLLGTKKTRKITPADRIYILVSKNLASVKKAHSWPHQQK